MRLTRRGFIGGVTVSMLSATPTGATSQLQIPSVDSVTLHVLVDNATFGPFLPEQTLPGLKVERSNPDTGQARMTRNPLRAEFGLSMLASSQRGAELRRVLVDFGYSADVLAHNMALLGIDPERIDAAVLSHGHLDHYGGFEGLFRSRPGKHALPLWIGGEEAFCERLAMIGSPPPSMGALSRAELAAAGLSVHVSAEPTLVADHAFTTGLIPLQGFERAAIPTQMRPGVGCERDKISANKRDSKQLPDDGEHELATAYNVKGLGLVVIASCSHRGVLNSIRRAQEVSGVNKIAAVVGGFHLVRPRTEDEARRTVTEMMQLDPMYVVPMHCTGDVFINEALKVMPQKMIRPFVGTRLTFSAA